jgi:hypothetical protein
MIAVGDVRRYEPAVASIELLGIAPTSEHHAILSAFTRLPLVRGSRVVSDRSVIIGTERNSSRCT